MNPYIKGEDPSMLCSPVKLIRETRHVSSPKQFLTIKQFRECDKTNNDCPTYNIVPVFREFGSQYMLDSILCARIVILSVIYSLLVNVLRIRDLFC